jgi:hypothetical protein
MNETTQQDWHEELLRRIQYALDNDTGLGIELGTGLYLVVNRNGKLVDFMWEDEVEAMDHEIYYSHYVHPNGSIHGYI